jgi:hypothetical protein
MGEQKKCLGVRMTDTEIVRLDQERLTWSPFGRMTRSQMAAELILLACAALDAGILPRDPKLLQGLHESIRLRPLTPLTDSPTVQRVLFASDREKGAA